MAASSKPNPLHGASKTTARLHLRQMEVADVPDLHEMRSDWEACKWATSPPSKELEDTERWMREKVMSKPEHVANFSIELLDPDRDRRGERRKVIGAVGAMDGSEIGYGLTPAYHGKGYGSEAVRGFLEMFWENIPRAPAASGSGQPNGEAAAAATEAKPSDGKVLQEDPRDVLLGSGGSDAQVVNAEPQHPKLSDGWDYVGAMLDPENVGSAKIMQKCGFTLWMSMKDDYQSVNLGLRSTAVYRLARPGTQLGPPPGPFEVDMDAILNSKQL